MRTVRTSIFVATAAVALSWSGLGRAEDDVNNKNTTPPPVTDTSSGTGTDSAYGTGYGSTQPSQPYQPYQQTQQQPAQQEPAQQQQTTAVSTTTTTSANVDPNASPPSSGADRPGWIYRPNRPMLFTGLTMLTATYTASVIVGASSDKDVDKRLYIPVVGPWLDLGQRDCGLGDCGQTEDWNQALLIGSGVLQGVGTVLTVASFFAREETDRPANWRSAAAKPAKPTFQITPMSMRAGGGVGAVGTF